MASENILYPTTPLRRLLLLLKAYRREIRYVMLYAVVVGLINLSLPLGVQAIIGMIAGGAISASWAVLVLFVCVGAFFAGILRLMQLSLMENLQRRVFVDASMEFAIRIPRLNLELLNKEHLPELVNRFFDTLTLQKGLPKLLIDGSTAILQILLSLLLLSFYHSTFVLSSLLLLLVLSVLFYWTAPLGVQTSIMESKYKYKLAFWLEELGRIAATFKLAGNTPFPIERADELTVAYLEAREKHWRILLTQFVSSIIFRVFILGGFLILGSLLVMENQINLGQFVAAEILVLFIIDSIDKLILLHETGYDVLTATDKLGEVTDLPIEREDGIPVEDFCNEPALGVELRNLSYQYSDGNEPVLKNFSAVIKPGQRIVVAGYNGAGKSTLMQVLSVLKRDFTGSLLFNGIPKQNINLRSLREHIGDISSQEDVFKGTVLENIIIGRKVHLYEALSVCEQVGLSEFIRQLPEGLNTSVLPGGKNIPRSIITKLLVARALVGNPQMLVLEEPLGNLNYRDRLRIAQILTDKSNPWTMVAVSEDPILASMADRVWVMREGSLVFDGSFDEVTKTEHFSRIFRTGGDSSTWLDEEAS